MAGDSESALARKLGIKPGQVVALLDPPDGLQITLPDSVTLHRTARGRADVVVAFFTEHARLRRRLSSLAELIFPDGGLWISWPKRASGQKTDVTADLVRAAAFPLRLVDNKICAIDDVWTAIRVVFQREAR